MKLFATCATQHLADHIALPHGAYTLKQFPDGELSVQINEDVRGQKVFVLAATNAPAQNFLELFFLLDALQQAGAVITLCFTYFGYGRQITAASGQAQSTQVICTLLNTFTISQTCIMHPHSPVLHDVLPFTAIYPTEFFCQHAQRYDAIAAPDAGAASLAADIARLCDKDLIVLTKERTAHEKVTITSAHGTLAGKRILLVDDIIATGNTVIAAAHALKKLGARSVSAAATHAVFAPGARERLEQSPLETIFVTNTLNQQSAGKIVVDDIRPVIATLSTTL